VFDIVQQCLDYVDFVGIVVIFFLVWGIVVVLVSVVVVIVVQVEVFLLPRY